MRFTWEDRDIKHQDHGLIDNISGSGVCVICTVENCPAIGSFISIDLALPMLGRNGSRLRITGTGRVIRHEKRERGAHAFVAEAELSIFPAS